jgi:AcrR family transcriptional regulator
MVAKIEDTKERITQAALGVFSRKGYASATTREIATEAGVNEVTLFRHYGNKENLLSAVIERFSVLPVINETLEHELVGEFRVDLKTIARHILAAWEERKQLIMIMMLEAQQHPEEIGLLKQVPILLRQRLAKYLESQAREKKLKDLHLDASAQVFLSGLFAYFLTLNLFGTQFHPYTTDQYVDNLIEIFLNGITAES